MARVSEASMKIESCMMLKLFLFPALLSLGVLINFILLKKIMCKVLLMVNFLSGRGRGRRMYEVLQSMQRFQGSKSSSL